jgi:hypothetical protein
LAIGETVIGRIRIVGQAPWGVSVKFLVNGHLLGLPTSHVQAF